MRTQPGSSHRLSCLVFALAVFAALYSIGSLVYRSNPVVAHEYTAPPTGVTNAIGSKVSQVPEMAVQADTIDDAWVSGDNHRLESDDPVPEESWPADVRAELAGNRVSNAIEFDPDQPAVTAENENMEPTGEYADQILAGMVEATPFEGEAFGFDPNMEPPDSDNAGNKPMLEFADQIRQEDIESTALLSGHAADSESYAALQEVDESSAPPTETGASIDPEAYANRDFN